MVRDFELVQLKEHLERCLGWRLQVIVPIGNASGSLNYRAVREMDGFPFLVKLKRKTGRDIDRMLDNALTRQLEALSGTKVVKNLFGNQLEDFAEYRLRCLTWCEGGAVYPDLLTDEELFGILNDHKVLIAALQQTEPSMPARDGVASFMRIKAGLRGLGGFLLKRALVQMMSAAVIAHDPTRIKVIHGDFHAGNFSVLDGRVTGIFDLEESRYGYPAEDIVRYYVCAIEHLCWLAWYRYNRILDSFAKAVRALPYPADEWHVAINGLLLYKVLRKVEKGCGTGRSLNLLWRLGLYRRMNELVEEWGRR